MKPHLATGLRINLFLTVVLGVAYPLFMTGICQVAFPHRANGSLITAGGKAIGSELIGQNFSRPEYLHPRPSAAGNDGYDAANSNASNYGPTNQKLADRVKAAAVKFREENPDYHGPIPADLLTASGSGLDPHISPDSAEAQAQRVAKARGVPLGSVRGLIAAHTEQPDLGLLGEPRVNVLTINLALDRDFPKR
jgi:K+-transporting ATPase ATPase C chain